MTLRLTFFALASVLLSFFTGCTQTNRDYYYATAEEGLYGDKLYRQLGAHGEAHVRRGEYLADAGAMGPDKGETYEQFHGRVLNTLTLQEYDLQMLKDSIEQKNKQIDYLQEQLSQLQQENTGLRGTIKTQRMRVAEGVRPKQKAPFERYKVQKSDTLQTIANRQYGTHTAWLAIYRFNLERLPNGPNQIMEGQELLLPNFESINALMEGSMS
ncbi:MAG: LysM peptidoglycan-binding domain-containing protein [Chlamydiia bacterium]|nr:LysM peptidoglycan-binding domain-containing protein [Chlamydiia bacterium]